MAKYNEILTGRHNRFISRLFGMKGAAPASQLSGDVQMVHPFFHGAENRLMESWQLWSVSLVLPGAVGNVSSFQMRLVAQANVLLVIEKLMLSTTNAATVATYGINASVTDLSTPILATTRDTRQLAATSSAAILSQTNASNPAGPVGQGAIVIPSNTNVEIILTPNQEIVLTGGFRFMVQTLNANTQLVLAVHWRERAMEDTERTP